MAERFDDLTDVYEATIDWPKRLGNEEPFYRWLFDRVGARSVLDVACGTGRHAGMFHSWGLSVEGADVSAAMLERCKARFGEGDDLRWVVRGFDQAAGEGRFDVAMCVGNSLALAADRATVRRAIARMMEAVRPGGAVIVHVLNLWRLADGPCVWQKCLRAKLPQGESLIIKGVHRCGGGGYVNVLVTPLDDEKPKLRSECVPLLGLEAEELGRVARDAGAGGVEVYGNYQRAGYERGSSEDLIMVALR